MRNCALRSPAPGDRAHGFGGLRDVGVNGFSWSSAASDSSAHYLDFNYARIVPQYLNYRAYGFPLRCLQE